LQTVENREQRRSFLLAARKFNPSLLAIKDDAQPANPASLLPDEFVRNLYMYDSDYSYGSDSYYDSDSPPYNTAGSPGNTSPDYSDYDDDDGDSEYS